MNWLVATSRELENNIKGGRIDTSDGVDQKAVLARLSGNFAHVALRPAFALRPQLRPGHQQHVVTNL